MGGKDVVAQMKQHCCEKCGAEQVGWKAGMWKLFIYFVSRNNKKEQQKMLKKN